MKTHRMGWLSVVILSFWGSVAVAQSWQDEWKAVQAKAKSQSLVIVSQENQSYELVLAEFSKKFGIPVQRTGSRPSSALAKIQIEQKNGQFVWDMWMGGTSNMVNTASPAGLIEPMEKYFILPEVKEMANWRHPDFLFGDSKRSAFTFVNKLEFYVLRNVKVLPNVKLETWDDFLKPEFKGKISMRDLSVPNSGTFAITTMYDAKGADFLRKFFTQQDVRVYENPQQLDMALTRGGQAVSIGLETNIWEQCRADNGCKEIEQVRQFAAAISLGVSVPKNPPHPEAVKVWLNWLLSREGQQTFVDAWAKFNSSGAVSMRKDVAPAKGHEHTLPDFTNPKNYVFVSSEHGSAEIDATIKIYKESMQR
jgi:ABC-type Fe3+ transport system substrate-binding protein